MFQMGDKYFPGSLIHPSSFQCASFPLIISGAIGPFRIEGTHMIPLNDRQTVMGSGLGRALLMLVPSSSAHRKVAGILAIAIVTFLVALVLARQAAARAGPRLESSPDQQSAMPAELAAHVAPIERRLRGFRDRLVALANPLIDTLRRNEALGVEPLNQEIAVQNARSQHANAELTRQIAEIAVVEYQEGTFKKDQAVAVGELKLAESDLERAKEGITKANERLAKIKQVSRGTTTDLANEYIVRGSRRRCRAPGAQSSLCDRARQVEIEGARGIH